MGRGSIKKVKKKNQEIYFIHENMTLLLERVREKKYQVLEEYKNDKRTYVAKILLDEKLYILKKIFYVKKIKKFLSIFKKGDAADSFFNIEFGRENFLKELAQIFIVEVKREDYKIKEEVCLMEYCRGNHLETRQEFLKAMDVLKKIHSLQRFHGDCNPNNFLINENAEIKVVDTKLKKMGFGNYRGHYDMLTLLLYFKDRGEYPYEKSIFYYFAYIIRQIRNFKNRNKNEKRD